MKFEWRQILASGADAQRIEGIVATRDSKLGHPRGSFPAPTTAILGAPNEVGMQSITGTSASWDIDLDVDSASLLRGYLVVATIRKFGGCHTRTKDQEVEIEINGLPLERFRMAHIPSGHDDYFYDPPLPDLPLMGELRDCRTKYIWKIPNVSFQSGVQHVTLQIQKYVRWDIDFIGFIYEVELIPDFDLALSFAGEDRDYVEEVARLLKQSDIRVFYDNDFRAELVGEDLPAVLEDIYTYRSRYTAMFISRHYRDKMWCRHERQSAIARAMEEDSSYLLPLRFDDTDIPGLVTTRGHLDLRRLTPEELVSVLLRKLSGASLK